MLAFPADGSGETAVRSWFVRPALALVASAVSNEAAPAVVHGESAVLPLQALAASRSVVVAAAADVVVDVVVAKVPDCTVDAHVEKRIPRLVSNQIIVV
ncbi:hypothetical protein D3C77_282230 [compost metagenome]